MVNFSEFTQKAAAHVFRSLEEEKEEEDEGVIKFTFVLGLLALAATFVVGTFFEKKHIHWMPEAAIGVLFGAFVAGMGALFGPPEMLAEEKFDFEFFMIFLLPPIIFEAGFNMDVEAFFMNAGPTMFFAFIGTFASTFVVGGIVYAAGQYGLCYPLGLLAALTFGSLISATDPVTVLAVFQALGVKVDLFSMVFGESVLNDAVAIVLSRTLLSFNIPGTVVNAASIGGAVWLFTIIFVGSMVIGIVYGIVSSFVMKHMNLANHSADHHDEPPAKKEEGGGWGIIKPAAPAAAEPVEAEPPEERFIEAALTFTFPWAAYFTAEALALSGIVAILFCGMVMAKLTRENYTEAGKSLSSDAFKGIAKVAETYVFIYLGMATVTFPIFKSTTWMLIGVAILACFIGRSHIFIGSWLTNCFRTPESDPPPISGVYQFVMWFSGLRGGVAFALAANSYAAMDFPTCAGGDCSPGQVNDSTAILQTTMIIALFTIFVFGGSITDVAIKAKVLKVKGEKKTDKVVFQNATLMKWLTNNKVKKDML